jgi:hypothetical protein
MQKKKKKREREKEIESATLLFISNSYLYFNYDSFVPFILP